MGRPGKTHVSQVPPGREDAHEPLIPPLDSLAREPVISGRSRIVPFQLKGLLIL